MNRVKRYLLNGILLSCVSIILRGLGVSFNLFIVGKLGGEGMGLLTLTGGIYGFAITFATSGINTAVVSRVSASLPCNCDLYDTESFLHVRKIMRNALCYCLAFSVCASIVLFLSAESISKYLLGDERTVSSLKLMSFSLVPISISSALNGYFLAVRRVYKNAISQFCEQGIKIGIVSLLLVAFVKEGIEYGCIAIVLGGVISEIGGLLVSSVLYFFDRKLHYRKNEENMLYVSKNQYAFTDKMSINDEKARVAPIALPIGVSAYVRSALSTVEHLAIPWGLKKYGLDSSLSLTSYGILQGTVIPLLLFPSCVIHAFSSLLVPELSSSKARGDNEEIRKIVSKVFSLSLLFSIGVSGIFICFSYEIGMFLYKSNEAGEYIRLLAPLIPLMYLDGSVDAMLKGLGEQIYSMRVNILDSFLSIILIVILLPFYGIYGYVVAIFVTELINASFSILRLINVTKIKTPILKWIGAPLICIVSSTFISRCLFHFIASGGKATAIIEITVASIIYFLLYILINKQSERVAYFFFTQDVSVFGKYCSLICISGNVRIIM